MEYLYYKEQRTSKYGTLKWCVCRDEIEIEKEDGYVLGGFSNRGIIVLKEDMHTHSSLDGSKMDEYEKETPELLEKWNIQQLEYEYSSKVREFLETDDHETMRRVIIFLDGVFKGE